MRWPRASGVRAHPLPPAVGVGRRAQGDAALVPARALPGLARSHPRARSPTSPCRPTSSSGSPARPRTTSPRRSRWSRRRGFDSAFMFQYSPRPGTRAAAFDDAGPQGGRPGTVRPARCAAGAHLDRARDRRRSAARRSRCSSRAATRRAARPGADAHEPDRAPGRRRSSRAPSSRRVSPRLRRTTSPVRSSGARRRRGLSGRERGSSRSSGRPPRERRRPALRSREASARRSCRWTRCWCTGGWTSGTAKPTPAAAGPACLIT